MTGIKVCLLCVVVWASTAVAGEDDDSCLKCHTDRAVLEKLRKDPSQPLGELLLDRKAFEASVHAGKGCTECHFDYEGGAPHSADAETVHCSECHDDAASAYGGGVHGRKRADGRRAADCRECHGLHDVRAPSDRQSRVHPLNVCNVCGSCHFTKPPAEATPREFVAERWTDNHHCRVTEHGGLVTSATCLSCHGTHDIRPATDPASLVARVNVAETCGKCHVGILEEYRAGKHHLALEKVRARTLVCSDCHEPHPVEEPGGDRSCLACHADHDALIRTRSDVTRDLQPLLIDRDRYARSVHAPRGCTKCHTGFEKQPHPKSARSLDCEFCHQDSAAAYRSSVHAQANADAGGERGAQCRDCHGVHDVLPATDRDSSLYPLNVDRTCGACHFSLAPDQTDAKDIMKQRYAGDVHGHGIQDAGLKVSATCVSCHGGHGIRARGDPDSQVARQRVDRVCGTCHVGALEQYRRSIHFLKSEGVEHKGATCTDCHHPHEISEATDLFRTQSVRSCSKCHDQRSGTYRLTYHGKATSLGYGGKVATCEDCHGNHVILPATDPESTINPAHIVETCGKCHTDSHRRFTEYVVHADPADAGRYPRVHFVWTLMNGLLIGVLALGALHALGWLVRSTVAGDWKRPHIPRDQIRWFRRWPRAYVSYHMVLMTSVLVLATTGLPLHFAEQEWARDIMRFAGGPVVTGWIHRVAALVMVAMGAVYVVHTLWRWLRRREKGLFFGPDSMVPRLKDARDLWGNLKWFLFLGPRPRYDRWTYWEKFDFWAVFWGLFVIGLSGWMLWKPEWWTHFVPGWVINAATIVHGIEALLDIAFIFTVHVFHANLRPDKFPMDTMFLTGRIPEHEFRHERPEEYERALNEGRLAELAVDPPARKTRLTAYVIGTCALAVGFFFVAMMILAVIQKW